MESGFVLSILSAVASSSITATIFLFIIKKTIDNRFKKEFEHYRGKITTIIEKQKIYDNFLIAQYESIEVNSKDISILIGTTYSIIAKEILEPKSKDKDTINSLFSSYKDLEQKLYQLQPVAQNELYKEIHLYKEYVRKFFHNYSSNIENNSFFSDSEIKNILIELGKLRESSISKIQIWLRNNNPAQVLNIHVNDK